MDHPWRAAHQTRRRWTTACTTPAIRTRSRSTTKNGARSVYYGLFVYACERIGTLWLLAAAQAALAASIVYALWRVVAPDAQVRSYLATMAVLAAGSSLPVFTGFAMPDLFAGFSVAATLLVTLYADRFGGWGKAVLWLLLTACVNFHGSNLLTSAGPGVPGAGLDGLAARALAGAGGAGRHGAGGGRGRHTRQRGLCRGDQAAHG